MLFTNGHEYHAFTTCVGWDNGDDINEMKDHPKCVDITMDTFRRNVNLADFRDEQLNMGYAVGSHDDGLHLKDDQYVGYHRSFFCGKPCYYMVWSCIEHIYMKAEDQNAINEMRVTRIREERQNEIERTPLPALGVR